MNQQEQIENRKLLYFTPNVHYFEQKLNQNRPTSAGLPAHQIIRDVITKSNKFSINNG